MKTYISPKTIVIGIQTSSLLSGSNSISIATQDYDGRSVLSRQCPFLIGDEEE